MVLIWFLFPFLRRFRNAYSLIIYWCLCLLMCYWSYFVLSFLYLSISISIGIDIISSNIINFTLLLILICSFIWTLIIFIWFLSERRFNWLFDGLLLAFSFLNRSILRHLCFGVYIRLVFCILSSFRVINLSLWLFYLFFRLLFDSLAYFLSLWFFRFLSNLNRLNGFSLLKGTFDLFYTFITRLVIFRFILNLR